MKRRRIGNKPPKPQPDNDFYEDDVTDDRRDTAYRTIQPEAEDWESTDEEGHDEQAVSEEQEGDVWL